MKARLNDAERRMWVENDEGLYLWWKRSRVGLYRFVRENRAAIDELVLARVRPLAGAPIGGAH